MGQPFIGECRLVGFNFAPNGWLMCQGQLIPISDNPALFNLIGTTYGGDGQQTFAMPDLQGRVPIHQGSNTGVPFVIGQPGG
ncbi:MAG: tail fiber protein, partial [Bryobacteraceae bacterium]